MPIRLYVMPLVTVDGEIRAKYSRTHTAGVTRSSIVPVHPDDCVAVIDATNPTLNSISSDPEVIEVATQANIDSALNASQASAAQSFLESRGLPAQFVQAGNTRRETIRQLVGICLFNQRLRGRYGHGFKQLAQAAGVTLDSQWSTFPQAMQDELIDVAESYEWDVPSLGLSGSSTLRQILKTMSDQFAGELFRIGALEV